MRGMTKILNILQAKHPKANNSTDLNRLVLASVVGGQNFHVTQMAIELSTSGASSSGSTAGVAQIGKQSQSQLMLQTNQIQDSLLCNKSIQSLVQILDERGLITMFKKHFNG